MSFLFIYLLFSFILYLFSIDLFFSLVISNFLFYLFLLDHGTDFLAGSGGGIRVHDQVLSSPGGSVAGLSWSEYIGPLRR